MTTPVWLTPKEAAAILGLTPGILTLLRRTGGGPPYWQVAPRSFRYTIHDIGWWAAGIGCRGTAAYSAVMDARVTGGTHDPIALAAIAYDASERAHQHHETMMPTIRRPPGVTEH